MFLCLSNFCYSRCFSLVCVCCNNNKKKLSPVATKLQINSPKLSLRSLSDMLEVEYKVHTETSETWRPLYSRTIAMEWAGKGKRCLGIQVWVLGCCRASAHTVLYLEHSLLNYPNDSIPHLPQVFVQKSHSRWQGDCPNHWCKSKDPLPPQLS